MKLRVVFTPSVRVFFSIFVATAALLLLALIPGGPQEQTARASHLGPPFQDGNAPACQTFNDEVATLLGVIAGPVGLLAADLIGNLPEPGWVWVDPAASADPSKRIKSVSGKVVNEDQVATSDFPTIHDSHDFFFNLAVDPGQEGVMSIANSPNEEGGTVATLEDLAAPTEIHNEWEIGTFPSETGSDPERTFPKWVWPNLGDRVYVNGHWIYDCGHPTTVTDTGAKLFRNEIHPPRAVATMRQEMRPMPGSGTTPVHVTATDLYIHGHAGFAVDDLTCGPNVIEGEGTCSPEPYPGRGTPIDDNYEWDICLPPLPFDKAALAVSFENGPGNTVTNPAVDPQLNTMPVGDPATDPCAAPEFGPSKVHVKIPLAGSGITPEDKYTRRIYAGWIFPPDQVKHLKLTLNKMILHEDQDIDPGDCECTFFYMSLDRSPDEWFRLQGYDIPTDAGSCPGAGDNTLSDWDDDGGAICGGNGELNFSGPTFDFFVGNGQPFTMKAQGYDQDCLDNRFGEHQIIDIVGGVPIPTLDGLALGFCFTPLPSGFCLVPGADECGDNDGFNELTQTFAAPDYGVGSHDVANPDGQYNMHFTVEDVPLSATLSDTSDLALTKDCKPDGPALAGQQFTCTILVQNPGGPGLPRDVVVDDTMLTDVDPSKYTLEDPTFTFGGIGGLTDPCIDAANPMETIPGGKEFHCHIGTVPIGGKAIITMRITSQEGGDFNNHAIVSTSSTDPDLSNNADGDSVHVTAVANLSVTKSDDPDPVFAGDTLSYTLSVHNAGPSTAVNVVATDVLPAQVSVVSVNGTGGAACNAGIPGNPADPTRCGFGSMAPGASQTMTIVVKVKPDAVTDPVTDQVILFDDARVSSDTLDLNTSNNLDTEATTVQAQADLVLVKTASGTPIAGTDILYEYRISNNGPSVSRNVTFRDNLPMGTSFVDAFLDVTGGTGGVPFPCTISQPINQVFCPLGDIAPTNGVPVIIRVTVHIASNVLNGTALTNGADVLLTDTPDPNAANSEDAVTVVAIARADIMVTKTSDADAYKSSGTVTYKIAVHNNGPSDAQGVVMTDNLPLIKQDRVIWLPAAPTCTMPAGGTLLTCNLGTIPNGGTKNVTVIVVFKGSRGWVDNTANVTTTTTDPDSGNNSSTRTVLIGTLPKP
ncbi:MAG TPA: DUF11 domain-containing protein [Dehalococcoidia bacterium]|nr:DUF11 domain-containing protein [Dehalococcoidia bacterium]